MDCKSCVNINMYRGFSVFLSSNNNSDKCVVRKSGCGFESISMPIYITTDVIIFSAIIFLQILTIRSSNALHNESTVVASSSTNKKIAKFSMRIMLLLCFFITPHQIIYVVRGIIQDQLNDSGKAVVEFIAVISATLFYANSSANAILFLMTNVRAKRFLQNSARQRKQ